VTGYEYRAPGVCDTCHPDDEPGTAVETVELIEDEVEVCQECLDCLREYHGMGEG